MEWKAQQRLEAQAETDRREAQAETDRRELLDAQKETDRAQKLADRRQRLADEAADSSRLRGIQASARLRAAVVDKGKRRAIRIDTPSPPPAPIASVSDSDSSDSDTDSNVPAAASTDLHHNHTHASGALCVNYGSITTQGPNALSMGTVVTVRPPPPLPHTHTNSHQTPRGKPGRAPTTPIDAAPLIVLRLRIADTGVIVPVCGVDTLHSVLQGVKAAVSREVRGAVVGLQGEGVMKEWVRMGERWSDVWDEDAWNVLKRRAGRCVRVPVVDVGIVWEFGA